MAFKVETTADGLTRVSAEMSADLDRIPVSIAYLKLHLALWNLHEVMFELGLCPQYGPMQEALVFSPQQFDRFRDACIADQGLASLFTLPRRKRPNKTLRRTMFGGVALVSMEELPDHYRMPFSTCRPLPKKTEEAW